MLNRREADFAVKQTGPFPLILATLLADRKIAAILSAAAFFIVILKMAGLAGWQCPVDTAIGRSCPGCGLTRALVALMGGNWQVAVQTHLLAPVAAVAMALLATVAILPAAHGRKIAAAVAVMESRSGIGLLVISTAVVQWIGRLVGYWYGTLTGDHDSGHCAQYKI